MFTNAFTARRHILSRLKTDVAQLPRSLLTCLGVEWTLHL